MKREHTKVHGKKIYNGCAMYVGMLLILLGIMDVLSGASLILFNFKIDVLGMFFAAYLVVKGLIFLKNLASVLDIAAGIIFAFSLYGHQSIFTYVAAIWLLQKAFFSLFFF